MKQIIVKIGGMSCQNCANHVLEHLKKCKGIINASVNLKKNEALVTCDENFNITDLEKSIDESGYEYLGFEEKN